jgi:hypothetical protein
MFPCCGGVIHDACNVRVRENSRRFNAARVGKSAGVMKIFQYKRAVTDPQDHHLKTYSVLRCNQRFHHSQTPRCNLVQDFTCETYLCLQLTSACKR